MRIRKAVSGLLITALPVAGCSYHPEHREAVNPEQVRAEFDLGDPTVMLPGYKGRISNTLNAGLLESNYDVPDEQSIESGMDFPLDGVVYIERIRKGGCYAIEFGSDIDRVEAMADSAFDNPIKATLGYEVMILCNTTIEEAYVGLRAYKSME